MKSSRERLRSDRHDPNLLLAYLRYALDDVRVLSERSACHLEMAIDRLAEDTGVIDTVDVTAADPGVDLQRP